MLTTASQWWTHLDSKKSSIMLKTERYAAVTIPKILLPEGYDYGLDQSHDYQSIGAQATNHLTNKMMLALFAPSRPTFRLSAGKLTKEELAAAQLQEQDIAPILAGIEREASKLLDSRAQRPKLYAICRHLIVTGNVLMILEEETIRVMGMRYWCVKRDNKGDVHTLIIRERILFDELDQEVQDVVGATVPRSEDTMVDFFKLIKRNANGDYEMTQWVDEQQLPLKFNGKWPADKLPYRVLTWDLADEADYATGLVEEYIADFEALSVLSESVVDGGVLGAEMRWLVNPTGMTTADDLNNSKNGDAVPGMKDDVTAVSGGNYEAIKVADGVLQRYEKRVATGFLMLGPAVRQAERVTAEEIRLQAQELETAFGGVYSALSHNIQRPLAKWLLVGVDKSILKSDIEITIITGLDALSRNGDLDNLRQALADLAGVAQLPEVLQPRVKLHALAKFVGDGRGIDLTPFFMDEREWAEELKRQSAAKVQEESAIAGGQAAAQGTPTQ